MRANERKWENTSWETRDEWEKSSRQGCWNPAGTLPVACTWLHKTTSTWGRACFTRFLFEQCLLFRTYQILTSFLVCHSSLSLVSEVGLIQAVDSVPVVPRVLPFPEGSVLQSDPGQRKMLSVFSIPWLKNCFQTHLYLHAYYKHIVDECVHIHMHVAQR